MARILDHHKLTRSSGAPPSPRSLRAQLPSVYRPLLASSFFDRPAVEERHATCDDCAMCQPPGAEARRSQWSFSPETKCCTYFPELPNFLVGALLADDDPAFDEGRRRIRRAIERRRGVTPRGLVPPRKYRLLYRHSPGAFGRALSMRCPYYEAQGGGCTIWAFREAVAITYHCKHVHGADGRTFWLALLRYLSHVDHTLSLYALHHLGWQASTLITDAPDHAGLAPGDLDHLEASDLDEEPDSQAHRRRWQDWVGREEELFIAAHQAVAALDGQALAELGGITHTVLLEQLVSAHQQMREPVLADPLLLNPSLRLQLSEGGVLLTGYSATDSISLRSAVYELLSRFDGRLPTAEVLALIRQQGHRPPSAALLRALYQHRILIAADR